MLSSIDFLLPAPALSGACVYVHTSLTLTIVKLLGRLPSSIKNTHIHVMLCCGLCIPEGLMAIGRHTPTLIIFGNIDCDMIRL